MYPQPTPKAKNRSDDGQTNGQTIRGAEEDCRQQGIAFFPLVAESLGGWHQSAEREVRKLGSALARHTGQLEGEAISHLWGRLGILLQRGNAAILANSYCSILERMDDRHVIGSITASCPKR